MAADFTGNPWIMDTAGDWSRTPFNFPVYVQRIQVLTKAGSSGVVVLKTKSGGLEITRTPSLIPDSTYEEALDVWVDGVFVDTIAAAQGQVVKVYHGPAGAQIGRVA